MTPWHAKLDIKVLILLYPAAQVPGQLDIKILILLYRVGQGAWGCILLGTSVLGRQDCIQYTIVSKVITS